MTPYQIRRYADQLILQRARARKRDRRLGRKERRAARLIAFVFGLLVLFRIHKRPGPAASRVLEAWNYGRYCGVGHGTPDGEVRAPISPTDSYCLEHDVLHSIADLVAEGRTLHQLWDTRELRLTEAQRPQVLKLIDLASRI